MNSLGHLWWMKMMVIPSNVNCSIHEKHQKQHMAHYCTSHMARMRAYIYGPNSGIYIIYIYIHISNARKLKCPNESIKPHLSIVSMDIHGYPESFSSPNGTPLELRGFQPDQSRPISLLPFVLLGHRMLLLSKLLKSRQSKLKSRLSKLLKSRQRQSKLLKSRPHMNHWMARHKRPNNNFVAIGLGYSSTCSVSSNQDLAVITQDREAYEPT